MYVCVGTEDLASCFRFFFGERKRNWGWVSHPSWLASKTETQRSLLSKCARRNARWSCEDLKDGCWKKSELVPATSRFLGWNETWGLRWTKNKMIQGIFAQISKSRHPRLAHGQKKIIGFRCQPPQQLVAPSSWAWTCTLARHSNLDTGGVKAHLKNTDVLSQWDHQAKWISMVYMGFTSQN